MPKKYHLSSLAITRFLSLHQGSAGKPVLMHRLGSPHTKRLGEWYFIGIVMEVKRGRADLNSRGRNHHG
jgi:hypothetical protein